MDYRSTLDVIPLWALFLVTVLVSAVSIGAGHRLGKYRRGLKDPERQEPVAAMVAATLGLLAFVLAFTFGLASTRYDERRAVVVDEANAIGTVYLRAEMLSEPESSQVRQLLRDYVDVRLQGTQISQFHQAIDKSNDLHSRLWANAVVVAKRNPESIIIGLFVDSLNNLIDIHSTRIMLALRNRIPGSIWLALYVVAILSMIQLGYHEGLTSNRQSLATIALVMTFSTVMLLIADLDRSHEGWLRVSQQGMIDLKKSFEATTGGTAGK